MAKEKPKPEEKADPPTRSELEQMLQETLDGVKAGHYDGLMIVLRKSTKNPSGIGWLCRQTSTVTSVQCIGALECLKSDMILKATRT